VALWPTASVTRLVPLITVNAEPEIVAFLTSTALVPVFVTLRLWTAVLPMATLPKVRVVELAESTPAPGVVAPAVDALV
jgi:hypothetical protein